MRASTAPPAATPADAGTPARHVTWEFARIWQGFMTARFTLGLLLLVLQIALFAGGISHNKWLAVVSLVYLAITLTTGPFGSPQMLGNTFNRAWLRLAGLDILAFFSLQVLQGSNINYTALFAMPILLASVLGNLQLALGTAASVTMLLLCSAMLTYNDFDSSATLTQTALSGIGYFAMALLGNQMSSRLASAGLRAWHNQAAALVQRQINSLVIESLSDGVLIVDSEGQVHAANPAAVDFLTSGQAALNPLLDLQANPAWAPLLSLTRFSLEDSSVQEVDVSIHHPGQGPRRLRIRTRPTNLQEVKGERLCVLFLQDQRELEARVRTEKLASMGRMSTAVAHEIRNPLAAIAQANALLDEDLSDPRLKRLTRMVSDNTLRLARIVDDILNVSRVQPHPGAALAPPLWLNAATQHICGEWARQNQCEQRLQTGLSSAGLQVSFDNDHLRRVLVNLLDNARRFASERQASVQVLTETSFAGQARLCVWSDGPPMDQTVEQHLFEPFFSSMSRSSGLGLYICRELCQGHGASIVYLRNTRVQDGHQAEGNEFQITFERSAETALAQHTPASA